MATEMKKTAKKVAKEVSYERVTSKKGFFSVTIKGEVVLWAVRDGGNYLYYVINEAKREIGERYLWKLISNEEAAKVDDWMIRVIKKANSRYGGIGVAPYVQLIGDPHDYCWSNHVQSFYPMCGDCVQIDLDWEYEYSEDYFINENVLSTVLAAVNKKIFGEHRIIFESIFA